MMLAAGMRAGVMQAPAVQASGGCVPYHIIDFYWLQRLLYDEGLIIQLLLFIASAN